MNDQHAQINRVGPIVFISTVILLFSAFKVSYLGLPYYWDEAWSYAPAVRAMHDAGPSLLPGSIDPTLSRGHPLFFYFSVSSWMYLVGDNRMVQHAFILLISIGVLVTVFLLGYVTDSPWIGAGASALTACCEPFLAQSGILLPEVLLTFGILLTILFFIKKNSIGYLISASVTLLIKESALVLILTLLVIQCIDMLKTRNDGIKQLFFITTPLLIPVSFFILQYLQFGWVFFPEHISLMEIDIKTIIYKLKITFYEIFERQGMIVLTYIFAFGTVLFTRHVSWYYKLIMALLYITAIKVLFGRWTLPLLPTLVIPVGCMFVLLLTHIRWLDRKKAERSQFHMISFGFILAYLLFTALNFYTNRYLIPIYPLFILLVLSAIHGIVPKYKDLITTSLVFIFGVILLTQIDAEGDVGDARLSYRDDVLLHSEMIRYFEDRNWYNEVFVAPFTVIYYMSDPFSGYLSGSRTFPHAQGILNEHTRFVIKTHSSDSLHSSYTNGFQLLKRFEQGNAWSEVYERK